jgi:hypothetical protein
VGAICPEVSEEKLAPGIHRLGQQASLFGVLFFMKITDANLENSVSRRLAESPIMGMTYAQVVLPVSDFGSQVPSYTPLAVVSRARKTMRINHCYR